MFHVILTIHILLCICLVFLVLIQQGKGADMGAAFGGGSNTVFGASGAPDFLTKVTTGMAVAFMVTSILLVRAYSKTGVASAPANPLAGSVLEGVKKVEPAPVAEAKPADSQPAAAPVQDGAPKAADAAPAEQAAPETEGSSQATDESARSAEQAAPQAAPAQTTANESNDASQTTSHASSEKTETAQSEAQPSEQAAPAN